MTLQTVDTLNYMIAGYTVIFGCILGYLVSLAVRYRKAKDLYASYKEHLDP
jgi:hypothetical protein